MRIRGLAVALLAAYCAVGIQARDQRNFINLSVNDGLSQSTVYSIYQDAKGFMWFGTRGGGLNKYDGYDFHVYKNRTDDEKSLTDNTVFSILEDSRGVLWVGTQRGMINRYDLNAGRFFSYPLKATTNVYEDYSLAVRSIYEDRTGQIWIGTSQGVFRYDKQADRFDPMLTDAPFPVRGITSICEDSSGYFYFASWDRLIRYSPGDGSYDQLTFPTDQYADFGGRINPLLIDRNNRLWLGTPGGLKMVEIEKDFSFSSALTDQVEWPTAFNYVRAIIESKDGTIWFGTRNGLFALAPGETTLAEYRKEPDDPSSLINNSIYSIFEDRVGTLWIGTWSGISVLDQRKHHFKHYAHQHDNPNSLSDDVVSAFLEDHQGTWIGTEQGGLNFLNKERTSFTAYKRNTRDPNSLPSNNVKAIFTDSRQQLWIGTYNGGLSMYTGNGRFKNYLLEHSVYSIAEIPRGTLWIGGRTGLHLLDLDTEDISRDVFESSSGMKRLESFVSVLFADSRNRLWIGTRNEGIYLYDPVRFTLRRFQSSEKDSTQLSHNSIISIAEDAQQQIWIGTNRGINRFNETQLSFNRMEELGLRDNTINGLQFDDQGGLWISTLTGLFNFHPESGEVRHFDNMDGLQSNEFNRRACYRNSEGEMFIGGVNGFNVFHPATISLNADVPPVVITDLKLFNESVVPDQKNSPLTKHITETEKIVLTHRQSSFSFEFVALNYLIPEKNSYMYILEGYEDEWNQIGRNRTASFMNLEPGNYTFHVKGSNNDMVWNEAGTSIDVKVLAPFYATPLAIMIYFATITLLLFAIVRIVRYRAEKENELKLERSEKARIKEMNANRLQFFTNIAHEFRTPLTLISGPLDKLIAGKDKHQSEYFLQLMRSNVNRMLRLVNQLMDFRKLENDKMPLKIQHQDLDKFLSQIVLGFEDLANKKMIELRYMSIHPKVEGSLQWFDIGILDKVVYNVLSNAFKFTPEQGIIEVRLSLNQDTARIEIRDTGKGIEQSKIDKIFERFYSDSPGLYSSTGIGLSFSRKLMDLHKGSIEVESEPGNGATFIVTLPVNRSYYTDEEVYTEETGFIPDRPQLDTITPDETYSQSGKKKQLILVVEDDPEMAAYLSNHLQEYKLLQADNGESAFELARKHVPDIVISDVMMPRMNGIEFCKALKKEFLTSHIPVILLSAKAALDEKIEGIESAGADAYLEKPFEAAYLNAQIRNLLVQRKKLKDKYSGLGPEDAFAREAPGEDELFLRKINEIVFAHIPDHTFNVDQLLEELNMSRSQLYRKFKAISDKNPSEYIRILRLQHASRLLKNSSHTISEVAYMSGFGNESHFNTCFKRHFGVSPGKYISAEQ